MAEWRDYKWDDLTPVQISTDEPSLAAIAYTDEYKELMGYFLAAFAEKELSERLLALTTAIIELNPAHYSVWDYRYDILQSLGKQEDEEWLSMTTMENPKNYQVWNYRQHFLVADKKFFDQEFLIIKVVLGDDSKNFHTWSHLKWVVSNAQACGCDLGFDNLLGFTTGLLKIDVYNNSCWSFRHFLVYRMWEGKVGKEEDLEFVESQISEAPENEAAWNYLDGINASADSIRRIASNFNTPRAIEMLASVSEPQESIKLYNQLKQVDPSRSGLWDYRIKNI